jgi:hypothetical protein
MPLSPDGSAAPLRTSAWCRREPFLLAIPTTGQLENCAGTDSVSTGAFCTRNAAGNRRAAMPPLAPIQFQDWRHNASVRHALPSTMTRLDRRSAQKDGVPHHGLWEARRCSARQIGASRSPRKPLWT